MNIPFVDLKLQYKEIQTEIENAIFKVIQSARFIQRGIQCLKKK